MKKWFLERIRSPRRKLALAAGILALAIAGLWLWSALTSPPEPEYQGKPLSYWLEQLDGPNPVTMPHTVAALRAMGSNAIPSLVKTIATPPSRLRLRLANLAWRIAFLREHFGGTFLTPYGIRVGRAQRALSLMELVAKEAVPPLARALASPDEVLRAQAAATLGSMGSQAKDAQPNLFALQKDHSVSVRRNMLLALAEIGCRSNECYMVFTNALNDPDPYVSRLARDAPGGFGHLSTRGDAIR